MTHRRDGFKSKVVRLVDDNYDCCPRPFKGCILVENVGIAWKPTRRRRCREEHLGRPGIRLSPEIEVLREELP
jgi:hypothetical protein